MAKKINEMRDLPAVKESDRTLDMKWIQSVLDKVGGLREYGRRTDTHYQNITYWIDDAPKMREFLKFICKSRKLGKYTWMQFGKMLDEEFLDDE